MEGVRKGGIEDRRGEEKSERGRWRRGERWREMRERRGGGRKDMRDGESGADVTLVLFEAAVTRGLKKIDKVIWRQSGPAESFIAPRWTLCPLSLFWTLLMENEITGKYRRSQQTRMSRQIQPIYG